MAVLLHAKQALRGGRGMALPILNSAARKRWVVNTIPSAALSPGKRPGTHCTGGWVGGSSGQSG